MNTFDDIMNVTGFAKVQATAPAQPTATPPKQAKEDDFNLEAWKEEQQNLRNRLFADLDEVTAALLAGQVSMQQYLDTQARFLEYSVSNALLILAQNPEASKIGTVRFWKDAGAKLQDGAQHLYILEKGHAYQRADGNIATGYNPVKVYDIAQTNVKQNPNRQSFSQRALLSGVIKDYPGKMTVVDELPRPVVVNEQNDILYLRGMEFEQGFAFVTHAVAHLRLREKNPKTADCKAWCAAYLLCQKTGTEFAVNLDWSKLTPQTDGDLKHFRKELKDIHRVASDLYDNIQAAAKAEATS